MHIGFRTDASPAIGTGHLMRCLALADAWRQRGAQCTFVCHAQTGHLLELVKQHGHKTQVLIDEGAPAHPEAIKDARATWAALADQAIHWLVVDHYGLDRAWEQAMRAMCRRLMVIDDLADRMHDCDLLLDPNLGRRPEHYDALVPPHALRLVGPTHALLRPEFACWRERSLSRRGRGQAHRLLIALGGMDKDNATGKILDALKASDVPPSIHINVVMGSQAPWLAQVSQQAASMPCSTRVRADVDTMAELMTESDLALGAAGGTAWERCCLGLPSLLLVLAANQSSGALALAQAGAAEVLSTPEEASRQVLALLHPDARARLGQMSQAAADIVDGYGLDRIIEAMVNADD